MEKTYTLRNKQGEAHTVTVTHEGCDLVILPAKPDNPYLAVMESPCNVVYLAYPDPDNTSSLTVFYLNKAHRTMHHTVTLAEAPSNDLKKRFNTPKTTHTLTSDNLDWLKEKTGHDAPGSQTILNITVQNTARPMQERGLKYSYDRKARSYNAPYTYLFQTYLAKYQALAQREHAQLSKDKDKKQLLNDNQDYVFYPYNLEAIQAQLDINEKQTQWVETLHAFSTTFTPLEAWVNHPIFLSNDNTLQDVLTRFVTVLDAYQADMVSKLTQAKTDHPDFRETLTQLEDKLDVNFQAFRAQIEQHQADPNFNHDQLQRLLCVQNRDLFTPSLGHFMASQMMLCLETGIDVAYDLSDNRFYDALRVPDSVSTLSDAKAMIFSKSSALDPAEYNDMYAPMSPSMLNRLSPQAHTGEPFSIMPYLSERWDTDELDEHLQRLIGFESDREANTIWSDSILVAFAQGVGASLLELTLFVPIRLAETLILGTFDLLGSVIYHKPANEKQTFRLHQWFSDLHAAWSPVNAFKRQRHQRHCELAPKGDHRNLLQHCEHPASYFQELFVMFSPQVITEQTRLFFHTIYKNIVKIPQDLLYLSSSGYYAQSEDVVYQRINQYQKLNQTFQKKLDDALAAKGIVVRRVDDQATITYLPLNEVASPFTVPREVMITLSEVIGEMFRKRPLPATLYFMFSATTFLTYLFPPAFTWMKAVPVWLQKITDSISLQFTGKPTSLGIMEQSIACFLEWKLFFFGTEAITELARGNFDFLEDLVREPEQLSLGVISMIALGMCLQYLPLSPTVIKIPGLPDFYNVYAEVYNVFVDEAQGAAEGTKGLTGLEFGFLGLKFAMFMMSLASGSRANLSPSALRAQLETASQQPVLAPIHQYCIEHHFYDAVVFDNKLTLKNAIHQQFQSYLSTLPPNAAESFVTLLTEQLYDGMVAAGNDVNQLTNHSLEARIAEQQTQTSALTPAITLASLTRDVEEALTRLSDSTQPLPFHADRLEEANKYYDKLSHLFDRYNQAVHAQNLHNPSLYTIDKSRILDVFYNKYCYQSSNNLLRTLLFVPIPVPPLGFLPVIYMVVVAYRLLKLGWATLADKPSVAHQVRKSFNKDLDYLFQLVGMLARVSAETARAIGYSLRVLVGPVIFLCSALIAYPAKLTWCALTQQALPTRKTWFKKTDRFISSLFSLHRLIPPLMPLRALYASAARIAGSSDDISDAATQWLIPVTSLIHKLEEPCLGSPTTIQDKLGDHPHSNTQRSSLSEEEEKSSEYLPHPQRNSTATNVDSENSFSHTSDHSLNEASSDASNNTDFRP